MTRRAVAIAWLGLALLVAGCSPAAAVTSDPLTPAERAWLARHPPVVLGAADDWGVAANRGAPGRLSGPMVEYLDLINQKLGTDIRIEAGPWHEMVAKAERREIDGLTLTAPLEERKKYFLFTDAFHQSPDFIYLRTGDLRRRSAPADLDGLEGRRVGFLRGSLRVQRALAEHPRITPVPLPGYPALAQALLRGEVDAVVTAYALEYWRASNGVVGIEITRIVPEIDASQVFSIDRNEPELVGILNKGIAAVSRDELEPILRRWFGSDYADRVAATRLRLDAGERAWLAAHPVVRVGVDTGSAPLEFADEAGVARGMSLAYLERIGKMLGLRFEIAPLPTRSGTLQSLASRELDLVPTLARTPSREPRLRFTEPYATFPAAIFSATNVAYIGGPDGLRGHTVAVLRGDVAEEWLRDNRPDLQLQPVADIHAALRAITSGRAYAFVGNLVTTSYYVGQSGLAQVRVAGEMPFQYRIAMGVRDDWPTLAQVLQKALDAISANERAAIYRDAISIQYQHRFDYSYLWIGLGVALLALLAVFAERTLRLNRSNARLRNLARDLSLVEERERRRLAGELHDSPMQKLALAQLQFSAARHEVDAVPADRLRNGLDLMREALDELHSLQFELSPPMLHREGLASALSWLASSASERSGVAFSLRAPAAVPELPHELALVLFQCARELVYNVAKHAAAGSATLELELREDAVLLTVADDGRGFEASRAPRRGGSYGLPSLRERVALFGGELAVASTPSGSRVSVRLPWIGQSQRLEASPPQPATLEAPPTISGSPA